MLKIYLDCHIHLRSTVKKVPMDKLVQTTIQTTNTQTSKLNGELDHKNCTSFN